MPLNRPFRLAGSDLYRLNCRACHGPDGAGAPPGIPSYLDAVRGSSPTLIRKRLEARGTPVSDAFVAELAAGGEKDLRDRLLHGGKQMPAFPHLAGPEVDALIHYLKQPGGRARSGGTGPAGGRVGGARRRAPRQGHVPRLPRRDRPRQRRA